MILSPDEAPEFFAILLALDCFANERLQVLPELVGVEAVRAAGSARRHRIRTALWARPQLIDEFVAANAIFLPDRLLADASRFTHLVSGRFFCERVLKQRAIVISTDNPARVYGIEGLTDRIDTTLANAADGDTAVFFDATLLPWRGRIVWDGPVSVLPLRVGPGIRGRYKRVYSAAKAANTIITSLGEPPRLAAKANKPPRDWRPALGELVAASDALGKPDTALQAAAFASLKASAKFAQATLEGDAPATFDAAKKASRAWQKVLRLLAE